MTTEEDRFQLNAGYRFCPCKRCVYALEQPSGSTVCRLTPWWVYCESHHGCYIGRDLTELYPERSPKKPSPEVQAKISKLLELYPEAALQEKKT